MRVLTAFVTVVFMAVSCIISTPIARASSVASDWLDDEPVIAYKEEVPQDQLPYSIDGNRDCILQRITTTPSKILPYPQPAVAEAESNEPVAKVQSNVIKSQIALFSCYIYSA